MSEEKDRGWLVHLWVGFAVVAVSMVGFGREVYQHGWGLTAHQMWEGGAWVLGSLAAFVVGLGVLRLVKGRW